MLVLDHDRAGQQFRRLQAHDRDDRGTPFLQRLVVVVAVVVVGSVDRTLNVGSIGSITNMALNGFASRVVTATGWNSGTFIA